MRCKECLKCKLELVEDDAKRMDSAYCVSICSILAIIQETKVENNNLIIQI